MNNRNQLSLYRATRRPVHTSEELKAIFACENRLMKSIRPTGDTLHDWNRERLLFHIDAFNRYAKLCDTQKQRCRLSEMNFAELAREHQTKVFEFIDKLRPKRTKRAMKLNDLMTSFLFSCQVRIFTRLSRADQDIVLMHDVNSSLFSMSDLSLSASFSDASDTEKEPLQEITTKVTVAPRAIMFQKEEVKSVKERAREYERLHNIESTSHRPKV